MPIHLGYELGTGKPIEIPLGHLCVTGITQEAGKTTALEALVSRSGLRAIAFITKRAESGFQDARRVSPLFLERHDWQFVESLLEATMRERLKFERSWIIRVCKGTSSLKAVYANVKREMANARRGLDKSVYETLAAYFEIVLPVLDKVPYVNALRIKEGLNVMHLAPYPAEVQALVIRSVMEWVYQNERDTLKRAAKPATEKWPT